MSEKIASIKDFVLQEYKLVYPSISTLPKEVGTWKIAKLVQYNKRDKTTKQFIDGEYANPLYTTSFGTSSKMEYKGITINLSRRSYAKRNDGSVANLGGVGVKQVQHWFNDEDADQLQTVLDNNILFVYVDTSGDDTPILVPEQYEEEILLNHSPSVSPTDTTSQEQPTLD